MFTLARKIDVNYTTNKIILAISIITAGLGYFITGDIKSGAYLGLGAFLTWALAREVDPKNEYSAFLCVALSLINIFYYKNLELLVIFWILLLLRMVNGITGKKSTIVDILVVLALTIYLTINMGNAIYLLPFILGMVFLIKSKERSKINLVVFLTSILVFLVETLYFNYHYINMGSWLELVNILVIVGVFITFIVQNIIKIEGVVDDQGGKVDEKRIRMSQILYGIIVLLLFLFEYRSLNNIAIYFSLILGVMAYSGIIQEASKLKK